MRRYGPVIAAAVAGLVVTLGVLLSSPTIMTSGPALVIMAAVERQRRSNLSERRLADRSVLLTVDHMISGLRSGLSLRQACITGGPELGDRAVTGNPLAPMVEDLRQGASLSQVTQQSASASVGARTLSSARLVMVTLAVLSSNGGPAVPALQRLRHALAGAEHGRRRADAESAQASASAVLLIAAPALFASVVAGVDASAARLYLYEGVGAVCVFVAVVLSWCGWWWMQHSISRVLRDVR